MNPHLDVGGGSGFGGVLFPKYFCTMLNELKINFIIGLCTSANLFVQYGFVESHQGKFYDI